MSADTLTADGAATIISAPIANDTVAGFSVAGPDEIDVLWTGGASNAQSVILSGYRLDGAETFQNTIVQNSGNYAPGSIRNFGIVGSDSGAMVVFQASYPSGSPYNSGSPLGVIEARIYDSGGSQLFSQTFEGGRTSEYVTPYVFDSATGYHLEGEHYDSSPGDSYYERFEIGYSTTGQVNQSETDTLNTTKAFVPYAGTPIGGSAFTIEDNQAQLSGQGAVTIPNEPAHAMTQVAAAALADGHSAAVAWLDSGTEHVSIYDATSNSFGANLTLDWGGASDLHVVALPDGGFAVSWMNGGAYKGELFDSAGNGGGIISLTGDFAGVASNGDLYTVGLNSSGQYVIQDYAIHGSGGSSPGGGSASGQTYTSDNNGDHWTGTTGDDTFHLGRGGDVVTGNGGNDTYDFAEIPWAGGQITDFNAGDTLDLTGLMSTTHDTGTAGFADGYLKITNDGSGDAQVWARYGNVDGASDGSGNWWLVETLNGVSPSSLQTNGDVVTVASGPTSVSTSDASYVAPSYVTSITLTGSAQHIDASATSGVSITSNNTGSTLIGGAGADTFHLGRGGDVATGGAGADIFSYAETPWAGGVITDFNASQGDEIDVSGLLAKSNYTGSDPFADQYLKYTTDANGDAQLWSDIHLSGNSGWWLVATLDGVSTSSLHYSGGLIT
jgi:RTX calcium-binding nonapeptide repeat (4 copies)